MQPSRGSFVSFRCLWLLMVLSPVQQHCYLKIFLSMLTVEERGSRRGNHALTYLGSFITVN